MKEMVEVTNKLMALGIDSFIHEDYRDLVSGKKQHQIDAWVAGEKARIKKENDYFRQHYKHILESDAILIVNNIKNGVENYIGGNVLMEMGQAYVNNKKIFFLYSMPTELTYQDEIEAMQPICLNGDLEKLKNYAE